MAATWKGAPATPNRGSHNGPCVPKTRFLCKIMASDVPFEGLIRRWARSGRTGQVSARMPSKHNALR